EVDTVTRVVLAGGSFTAYLKNGRIRTYAPAPVTRTDSGGTASQVVATWRLALEQDRLGNSIRFTYKDFGIAGSISEVLLTRIDYTTTSAAPAQRHVDLVYVDKTGIDRATYYVNGMAVQSVKRLQQIQMYAPNPTTTQLVWSYTLGYQPSGLLGHSLLT